MNTEVIRKDWVGSVINGKYRLVEWLGSFGQAGVYLCEIDEGDAAQKAAIKLFPAAVEGAAACASGWSTAAGLSHPHLVRVLDTGRSQVEETGVLYVVTEYAGEILSEILTERALTPDEVRQMLAPVLDVLDYLREDGLVHARLKPSNIMVIDDELKLSSENIRGAAAAFTPPKVLETYDAPEKTMGRISSATDVWSLGVTLVEALTRIPPAWNRTGQIEPLVPPSVPEPFNQIARECLRLDPANRCRLEEIRACLQTGAAIPHRPIKAKARPIAHEKKPIISRRNAVLAAVALIGILAIVLIVKHHTPLVPATSQGTSSAPANAQAPAEQVPAPAQHQAEQTPAPGQQAAEPQTPLPASPAPQTQVPAPQASSAESTPTQATAQPQPAQSRTTETPAPAQAPPPEPVKTQPLRTATGPAAKGAVAQKVMPDVPEKATRTIHGTVKVGIRVNVSPSGSVGDASIDSQGPSRYFANLALEAARNWKFEPAQENGQSVASVWTLQFEFRQDGTEVTPTEQTP